MPRVALPCISLSCIWVLALLACKPEPTVEPEPTIEQVVDDGEDTSDSEPEPVESDAPAPAAEQPTPAEDLDAATRQKLSATISGHLDELQLCYEDELSKDKTLAGKMTYTITIQATGKVSGVAIDLDEVQSDAVRDCAVAKIETWSFSEVGLEEPADVTFSVNFAAV